MTCVIFNYSVGKYKGCACYTRNTHSFPPPGWDYAKCVEFDKAHGGEFFLDYIHRNDNVYSSMTLKDWGVDEDGRIYFIDFPGGMGHKIYKTWRPEQSEDEYYLSTTYNKDDPDIIRLKTNLSSSNSGRSNLWIQAGANTNQGINISLVDATAAGIGLNDVSVLSGVEAGNAIQTVDNAISQVSRYRSDFGAQQNRLEHAMAVDDNTSENLQTAESRIRDLDMADEIVKHAKLTMLEQFMQTILVNANSQPESVSALLS